MNVFHHHLETVKAAGFWNLYLCAESLRKVFKHNTITSCEEREYVFDEVLLVLSELLPVFCVLTEIDLIDSPETSHLIFVHLPDVFVLDGKDNEAVRIFLEKRLGQNNLSVLALARCGNVLWRDDL